MFVEASAILLLFTLAVVLYLLIRVLPVIVSKKKKNKICDIFVLFRCFCRHHPKAINLYLFSATGKKLNDL